MSETTMSPADMAAMMNNNGNGGNSYWNNPFMYLIWYALFRNGGFGGNAEAASTATIDMNAKLNQLSQQIQDNQATNTLNSGIQGNHDYLHDFSNAVNMGFAGNTAAINNGIQSGIIGNKDLQSAIQTSSCATQQSILNQTNQLGSRIDQLANGVQQGFAQLGYAQALQTNELNTNANANTQKVLDALCQSNTQALRDKVLELSQEAQTQTIINNLKSSCSCSN